MCACACACLCEWGKFELSLSNDWDYLFERIVSMVSVNDHRIGLIDHFATPIIQLNEPRFNRSLRTLT